MKARGILGRGVGVLCGMIPLFLAGSASRVQAQGTPPVSSPPSSASSSSSNKAPKRNNSAPGDSRNEYQNTPFSPPSTSLDNSSSVERVRKALSNILKTLQQNQELEKSVSSKQEENSPAFQKAVGETQRKAAQKLMRTGFGTSYDALRYNQIGSVSSQIQPIEAGESSSTAKSSSSSKVLPFIPTPIRFGDQQPVSVSSESKPPVRNISSASGPLPAGSVGTGEEVGGVSNGVAVGGTGSKNFLPTMPGDKTSQENVDRTHLALRQEVIQRLTNLWYDETNGFWGWMNQIHRIFLHPDTGNDLLASLKLQVFPRKEITEMGIHKCWNGSTSSNSIGDCFYSRVNLECDGLQNNYVNSSPETEKAVEIAEAFCQGDVTSFKVLSEEVAHSRIEDDFLSVTDAKSFDKLYQKIEHFEKGFRENIETLKTFPSYRQNAFLYEQKNHDTAEKLQKALPLLLGGLSQAEQEHLLTRLCTSHPEVLSCNDTGAMISSLASETNKKRGKPSKLQRLLGSFLQAFLQTPVFLQKVLDLFPPLTTDLVEQKSFSGQTWQALEVLFNKDRSLFGYLHTADDSVQDTDVFGDLAGLGCSDSNPSLKEFLSTLGYASLQALDSENEIGSASARPAYEKIREEASTAISKIMQQRGISINYLLGTATADTKNEASQKAGVEIAGFIFRIHALVIHLFDTLKLLLVKALSQDPKVVYSFCPFFTIQRMIARLTDYEPDEKRLQSLLLSGLSPQEAKPIQSFFMVRPWINRLMDMENAIPIMDKSKPPFLGSVSTSCLKYVWNPAGDPTNCQYFPPGTSCRNRTCDQCTHEYPCDGPTAACICLPEDRQVLLGTITSPDTGIFFLTFQNNLFTIKQSHPAGHFLGSYGSQMIALPDPVFQPLLKYTVAQYQDEWLRARMVNETGLCLEQKIQRLSGQQSRLWEDSTIVKTYLDILTSYLNQYAKTGCPLSQQAYVGGQDSQGKNREVASKVDFPSPIELFDFGINRMVSSISFQFPSKASLSPSKGTLVPTGSKIDKPTHGDLEMLFDLKDGQKLASSCDPSWLAPRWKAGTSGNPSSQVPTEDAVCAKVLQYLFPKK